MNEHKANMIKLMQKVAYRHSTWQVFADFVEMAAITISNAVDLKNRKEREQKYLSIINGYSKEEQQLFPKIFAELVLELEEKPTDILGDLFMEMGLGSKWKGQFFTPMSICKACGDISVTDLKEKLKSYNYITVSEPACGGGAMVIGLALAMRKLGINYQQKMVVTAADLDIKAVHMCYLQLSLLGIPALVVHGDTLKMKTYSVWTTPLYVLGGWEFRKQKKEKAIDLSTDESGQMKLVI